MFGTSENIWEKNLFSIQATFLIRFAMKQYIILARESKFNLSLCCWQLARGDENEEMLC